MKFLHRDPKTVPTNQPRMAKAEPPATVEAVQVPTNAPFPDGVAVDSNSSTGLSVTQAVAPGDYVVTHTDGSKHVHSKASFEASHQLVPSHGADRYSAEEASHMRSNPNLRPMGDDRGYRGNPNDPNFRAGQPSVPGPTPPATPAPALSTT